MKEKGHILQLASMDQLLRKGGALRVSVTAKKALRDLLEHYALSIVNKAVLFAKHAGRTTVKGEDVLLATK